MDYRKGGKYNEDYWRVFASPNATYQGWEDLASSEENLQNLNKTLQDELNSKNEEIGKLRPMLTERDSMIAELRSELATFQENKNMLSSTLEDTRNELDGVKGELESQEHTLRELKEKVHALEEENGEKEQEISKLKDDLESANSELGRVGQVKSVTESQLQSDLDKTKAEIRLKNQEISKLEGRLSNSQTLFDKSETEGLKLKEEIKSLKDKIRYLEKKRASEKERSPGSTPRSDSQSPSRSSSDQIDKHLSLEAQRRSQERIQELQQKVIQVNCEKQKIKGDYDEAVKALEAVDKVYSVREMALQKYKAELEEANQLLKKDASEIELLKQEIAQLKGDLCRAEESKAEREELRQQIARAREASALYKDELETVRKDLSDQVHEVNLAQSRARERGKKIQIMELEIREVKDTLLISKSVLEEKEKNMSSIKASLEAERNKVKKLEQEIDELSFVKKKLNYTEEEKARVESKLKQKEQDLKDSKERLNNLINKKKEQDLAMDSLQKEQKKLQKRCEDREDEIRQLRQIIEDKESDIEEQVMELIHLRDQIDELNRQLTEIWASYTADKAYWRNKADRSFTSRRRPKSAPPKRFNKVNSPPEPSTHPASHSISHRRIVNKLGVSLINPSYIQTQHKNIPRKTPSPQPENESQTQTDEPTKTEATNKDTSLVPIKDAQKESPPRLSPRPPETAHSTTKPLRPMSSYGMRTYPPAGGTVDVGRGYYSDREPEDLWMESGSLASGDSEEQFAKHVVHKGDRVMIQSDIGGDGMVNVSGVVKYVGKVGKKTATSSVYVGLKLDQSVDNNNCTPNGKRYFKYHSKNGKLVKVADVQAFMHPRLR
ncbi:intracellular protein transport protein USO1 isoform X3 [Nematostella vectensis]|uniref:intracellular protein transport protein USO1 isoform X3 n=1 Tax=Nematostella vectensis TaxID=45351 RepID=UPI00207771A0|nr:intracellular protein transport protein USO1 isoform X3 [Nematostella vectensis]